MQEIFKRALGNHQLTKEEIVTLLRSEALENELFATADAVRKKFVGDEVHLRGLIEFSNICKNNCLYCGLRRDNKNVERYRMQSDEIIEVARVAAEEYGFKTIVMQSGEDPYYNVERMQYIISGIKKLGVSLTLSMGEKNHDEYKAYKDAGADRYLIRIETTNKDLYRRLDPEMNWETRKQCLLDLANLDYEVGSGIMVGLPNQSLESIAEDLLFLKELKIDMAGIGPFIPHPDTPMKDEKGREFKLALRTMALMRILLPDINIPATTAMETLHPDGRIMALQCGANVIMPNVTTREYRKLYQLYPGKIGMNETAMHARTNIGEKIVTIGRTIGLGHGCHQREK